MEKDVVCGMQVDPAKAAGSSEYNGKTYYFCSKSCKTKFDANPAQYSKSEHSGGVSGGKGQERRGRGRHCNGSEGVRYGAGGHGMNRHTRTHAAVAPAEVLDPFCSMTISPDDAIGHVDYEGLTYYFCSQGSLDHFRATPEALLGERAATPATPTDLERDYTCPMDPEVRHRGPAPAGTAGWRWSRSMLLL